MERCIYTYKWHVGLDLHELIHGPLLTNYDGQINHQPTKEASDNNTKTLVPIPETLVPEAHQSHDTNHASTSSYPIAQDRWSRYQHIKIINIIGDPGEDMLT
ncbi:hypothetical protein Tco_1271701 [Tanacetum coccineum]